VPTKPPGFHKYVVPAILLLAVNEEDPPLHIVEGVAVGVITGFGLTVTLTVAVPVQPAALPVTVYVVVVAGVTDTGVPVKPPGFHTKVVPEILLLAANEEDPPLQIVGGVAVGVITGLGLTVTITIAVPVQPAAVPVTV
jgi:hypothetical protein